MKDYSLWLEPFAESRPIVASGPQNESHLGFEVKAAMSPRSRSLQEKKVGGQRALGATICQSVDGAGLSDASLALHDTTHIVFL